MTRHSEQPGVTRVDGFESTDMLLIGAPMQLNLVLLNLVSNAAKFTTKGAITFSVTVEEEASDWAKVKFAVTDTGVGIPIDEHESIFEMRSQTGGLVSQSKGFGIGLNIASKLTGLMGGRLEVKSPVKDGKGSEFSFTLSLKKAAEQHKVEEGVEEGEAGLAPIVAPPMHLRVLIVDDGKMNQKLLRRKFEGGVFEALRWSVDIAINGEQALEKIDAGGEFDLIVMDENMRETGGRLLGTEVTKLIRSREGRERGVIIVGHSGNSTWEDKERGRVSGQDAFWEKPPPKSEQMLQDVSRLWDAREGRGGERNAT